MSTPQENPDGTIPEPLDPAEAPEHPSAEAGSGPGDGNPEAGLPTTDPGQDAADHEDAGRGGERQDADESSGEATLEAASSGSGEDEADPTTAGRRPLDGHRTEELVREGEVAADFLEGLLDIADLSGDLEVDIENDRAAVSIVDSEDGPAPARLVGPGGQVLDALQELTRLAVQAETGERSRLMLDVAGYRADRRAALVTTARRAVAEVAGSGEPRELEPMTAFERKVVHDEVLAAGLRSESAGVEPSRYVVVLPA